MNIADYMKKYDLSEADLDAIAEPYETGDWEPADSPVYSGSHLDVVGKKRVTVIYDAAATQKVASIARDRGLKPSKIYRAALEQYLVANS